MMSLALISMNLNAQDKQVKPWPVPDEYKNMKNPVAKGEASNKAEWYFILSIAVSCHGKTGLGDGVKARSPERLRRRFLG